MKNNKEDTIFALSTPYGQSAVAVIRISGTMCRNISKNFVSQRKLIQEKLNLQSFLIEKKIIDSGIMIFFKSPFSFTGEDMLEIQCHGVFQLLIKFCLNLISTIIAGQLSPRIFKKSFLKKKWFTSL